MDTIRAATAVPARVMGLANDSAHDRAGLRADLIVVDGNPLERISDIRHVRLVSTGGKLHRPPGSLPIDIRYEPGGHCRRIEGR